MSLFCLTLGVIPEAFARVGDDAVVLPKGYSRLFFDAEFYIPFEKRYDSNGNVEALGADAIHRTELLANGPMLQLGQTTYFSTRQLTLPADRSP